MGKVHIRWWKENMLREDNEYIYYVKGLAIISVICAHCNSVLDSSNHIIVLESLLLQNIGTYGVICFFVISGFLFHHPGKHVAEFIGKKIKSIVIPWLISATCVYLYVYLRKPPLSLEHYIKFVLGDGSYCYYLSVLMLLYLSFLFIPFLRTSYGLCFCEVLTIISTIFFYNFMGINPYLNIFNWIGYFAFGLQLGLKPFVLDKIKEFFKWKIAVFSLIVVYVLVCGRQFYIGSGGGYWNGINVFFCWLGAILLVVFAQYCIQKAHCIFAKVVCQSGRDSFAIYIWHMPIAGITAKMMNSGYLRWFVLIRPIIILITMLIFISIFKKATRNIKKYPIAKCFGINS